MKKSVKYSLRLLTIMTLVMVSLYPVSATNNKAEDKDLVTVTAGKQLSIQVSYIDEEGSEILPTETLKGQEDDIWYVQAKHIDGYELSESECDGTTDTDELESEYQGTFDSQDQKVRFIYNKAEGSTPAEVSEPTLQNQVKTNTQITNVETNDYTLLYIMIPTVVIVGGLAVLFVRHRQHS